MLPTFSVALVYSEEKHGPIIKEIQDALAPVVEDCTSASLAMVPNFYWFAAKSAKQLGKPVPQMTVLQALKAGTGAAGIVGLTVGGQILATNVIKANFADEKKVNDLTTVIPTAMVVSLCTAPCLAALNGLSIKKSLWESVSGLKMKQAGAIVVRETTFLLSLEVSKQVSEQMKPIFGDNKLVTYTSVFLSSSAVGALGHPADTALTIWQSNQAFISKFPLKEAPFQLLGDYARQSLRGVIPRAIGVGGFNLCYKVSKDFFEWVKQS